MIANLTGTLDPRELLVTDWPVPERVPLLCQDEAHIWVAGLDAPAGMIDSFWCQLSDEERSRAKRFHFPLHKNRFVAGRGILRTLLGEYLDCAPEEIRFVYGPAGKPALELGEALEFNVAHSQHAALFAFAQDPVGVDIEIIRATPEHPGIAHSFFAEGECARLAALPPAEQDAAFLRCWTRKEAFLKTSGTGISAGLKSFEVTFETDHDARLLSGGESDSSLHHLDPAIGFVGALHINHPHPRLRCYQFQAVF